MLMAIIVMRQSNGSFEINESLSVFLGALAVAFIGWAAWDFAADRKLQELHGPDYGSLISVEASS